MGSSGSNLSNGSSSNTSTVTRRSSLLRSRSSGKGTLDNRNYSHSSQHPSRAAVAGLSDPNGVVGFREENDNRYTDNHENNYNYKIENKNLNKTESSDERKDRPRLLPVTEVELQKKHTRFGPHMCRYDINEALEEIQNIVWKRVLLECKSHHKSGSGSSYDLSFESSDGGGDPVWFVSEQELRENCAFFKHGESTARSTLQLLCSLKRLKQVPGRQKHSGVTYICLFGGTTKE